MKASKALRFAVAAVFAGGSAISHAALTSTAISVASELPVGGITLIGSAGGELNFSSNTTTFSPSAGQSLQVNVTLDNGAKFVGAPALKCQVTNSGAGGATAATANGVLNLGGAASNNAVFTVGQTEVSSVASGGSISACTFVVSALTVTGAHVSNNASITYQYGNLASGADSGPVVAWKKGVSANISAGQNAVATVTGGFLTVSGGVSGAASVLVSAGAISFASNGTGRSTAVDLASVISAGDILTTASITVGGNSLGAAKTTAGVWIVTAGSECTAANRIASATGGLASVTFSGLTTAQISAGVNVCVLFNGTSAIPEGAITASLTAAVGTGYSADTTLSTTTLSTITRNGSSTRAMNIPAVTNADQAFIRVTNTSTIAGKVYGTMYGQDGVRLGNANVELATSAEFVPNATLIFDAATLKTKLGIAADWAGRAQLVLTAETTAMRAQNLIRVSNGTLVNVGGDTSTGNN